jgi:membrane associated rhomboid family serine protease
MKYLFVLIFIFVYALFGKEPGYTASSPLYTHFTYMFSHAGMVHLAINSIAFTGMFRALENLHICKSRYLCLSLIACGFMASFPSQFDTPTVGSSSMVYAMIGIYAVWVWRNKRVMVADRAKFRIFIVCVCLSLAISYLKPGSNFPLHLLSLLAGGMAALIWRLLRGF